MNEEGNNKNNIWGNRIFYIVFALLIIGSVGFTFYRIVIVKDYQIVAETSCDPAIEACFHYAPEPCAADDTECLAQPAEEPYDYKMISKKAASIYECEKTSEKLGCNEDLTCLDNEIDCSYTYCDPENLADGEVCSEKPAPAPEEILEATTTIATSSIKKI